MKQLLLFLFLLLAIIAQGQAGTQPTGKKLNLSPAVKSTTGWTPAQRDSINNVLLQLWQTVNGKKNVDPDEVPYTIETAGKIENLLARPVYDTAAVRLKSRPIPAADITGTIPIDSIAIGGLSAQEKAGIDTALMELQQGLAAKKDIDPDEVPFTVEAAGKIEDALARPVYDPTAVRLKNAPVPATDISGTVALDSIVAVDNFRITANNWLGSKVLATTYLTDWHQAGTGVDIPDSSIELHYVPIDRDTVIRSIGFRVFLSGAYTAGLNNRLGLYNFDLATRTLTLVAFTANNPTLFQKARGTVYELLTAPYTIKRGAYFVGLIHTRTAFTTKPQIYSATLDSDHPYDTDDMASGIGWSMRVTARGSDLPAKITASQLTVHKERYLFLLKY